MADLERAKQLALERRFPEAAEEALAYAALCLKRGRRPEQFDALASAGKFYNLAGMHADGVRTLGEALDLLEADMAFQPRAVLAIRRLSEWPELYTRAALSCLELKDPLGAVAFAERGRARAISHRLGAASGTRPTNAPRELWERYVHRWRLAVAEAANDLVDADEASAGARRARLRRFGDELGAVRDELESHGVGANDLPPVGRPFDVASLPGVLARASRPTIVLYSMRLNEDVLRLVLVDRHGARELVLSEQEQRDILAACDRRVASLIPSHAGGELGTIGSGVDALIAEAGPPIGAACLRALAGLDSPRLVWIAHSSLITLPLAACPVGRGVVADLASVVAAPSLTLAAGVLGPDLSGRARASAILGREEAGQALTSGAGAVARVLDPPGGFECSPRSEAELQTGAGRGDVLHVSCHGHYNWADPLRGTLQLGDGFDLPFERLFDGTIDLTAKLVLLGACDSASVAQGLTNESVGVPTAMLAAGARAVVGAAWPVPRIAAVAFCLRFMQELRDGLASPEATRMATLWVRAATYAQIAELAERTGHPIREEVRPVIDAGAGDEPACADPTAWAAFVHWGGAWVARSASPHSAGE